MTTLEVINPFPKKGIHPKRRYVKRNGELTDDNYVELGVIVKEDGESKKDKNVEIRCTDYEQNTVMTSTGNVTYRYSNGQKEKVYYYPFQYEFTTEGTHLIYFVCDDEEEKVTINVEGN